MSKFVTSSEEASKVLSVAGMQIRRKLKAIYGSPEAAEKAIREQAENVKALEEWSSIRLGDPFSFEECPPAMRENAILSTAAAFLVWDFEQTHG